MFSLLTIINLCISMVFLFNCAVDGYDELFLLLVNKKFKEIRNVLNHIVALVDVISFRYNIQADYFKFSMSDKKSGNIQLLEVCLKHLNRFLPCCRWFVCK